MWGKWEGRAYWVLGIGSDEEGEGRERREIGGGGDLVRKGGEGIIWGRKGDGRRDFFFP